MIRFAFISAALAALVAFLAPTARSQTPADPCFQCGLIYSSDGSGNAYVIDTATGTSTLLGSIPVQFDLGATPDGRLFAVSGGGSMTGVDTCTLALTPLSAFVGGNGMGGHLSTTDLYTQGPPLNRTPATGSPTTTVGGSFGPLPPQWCGGSSGDLAMNPADGLFYSTLGGCGCSGDMLVVIDPATGDVLSQVGCLTNASSGAPIGGVFGVAFDSDCRFIGGQSSGAFVWSIDLATAQATQIPIAGGYNGTYGMASAFCAAPPSCLGPPSCAPLTQGFWKRQCKGPHPSGEDQNLAGYVACVASQATFAGVTSAADICDRLHPDPQNDKCEQAEAQFMALMLNTCSGRLQRACCMDSSFTPATTVGAAIDEIDALLSNPGRTFSDCVRAQAIADDINTSRALCSPTAAAPSPRPPRATLLAPRPTQPRESSDRRR